MPRPHLFLSALIACLSFVSACNMAAEQSAEEGVESNTEAALDFRSSGDVRAKRAAPSPSLSHRLVVQEASPAPPEMPTERLVIKTASLDLEIDNYDAWMPQIQEKIEAYKGYVVDASTRQARGNARRGNVQVRVPQGSFVQLLNDLKASALKVEGQQQGGEDVTEEFFDLEMRLENNKRTERRFREILRDAKKVEDILAVERELSRLRQTIERLEGRRRFLKDRVDLATVRVNWHETYPVVSNPRGDGFWSIVGAGFGRGLRDFAYMLRGIITFAIGSLPLVVFLGVLIWVGVRWARWRRGRKLL